MPSKRTAAADRMAWPVPRVELLLASLLAPSSWDPLIQAGLRAAVLRCPRKIGSDRECSSTGHWRDWQGGDAPTEAPRPGLAGEQDDREGAPVWRTISDVWECSRCGATTRNPRIGQIGSMADCNWRGKGRMNHGDHNAVEDALIELCDLHRRSRYGGHQEDPNQTPPEQCRGRRSARPVRLPAVVPTGDRQGAWL